MTFPRHGRLTTSAVLVIALGLRAMAADGLFGTTLRPSPRELLHRVEQLYGRPVREKIDNRLPAGVFGYSAVTPDGGPVIAINDNEEDAKSEENIVHELFHLKMQAEGYPLFEFTGAEAEAHKSYLVTMRTLIYDPLTHAQFFPDMKRMGLDPEAHLRALYRFYRKNGMQRSEDGLALYFFKLAIETNDNALISDAATWYEEQGWRTALDKGRALVRIARANNSGSPSELASIVIACANRLLQGKARLRLLRIESREYGSIHRNFAIIEVVTGD